MCLENVTYKRAKIVTEDIPCYKILVKMMYPRSKPRYMTPYMLCPVVLGYSYESHLDSPDSNGDVSMGLHAFLTLEQARSITFHRPHVIVKCIVPKGARYYIGVYKSVYGKTAIAASKLRYNNKPLKT
jgi:hypothetical protein